MKIHCFYCIPKRLRKRLELYSFFEELESGAQESHEILFFFFQTMLDIFTKLLSYCVDNPLVVLSFVFLFLKFRESRTPFPVVDYGCVVSSRVE